jgi:hypothetical protein
MTTPESGREPSKMVKAIQRAAAIVATWSPAKRAYAKRATSAALGAGQMG